MEPLRRPEYLLVLTDVGAFWLNGAPALFYRLFLEEVGGTAFVVRDRGMVVTCLLGLGRDISHRLGNPGAARRECRPPVA